MEEKNLAISRYKLFIIFAIDLGQLLTRTSQKKLQKLRAEDKFYKKLIKLFDQTNATADAFTEPVSEEQAIRNRAERAKKIGGKNIWSELFYKEQTPILFRDPPSGLKLPISKTEIKKEFYETGINFSECQFKIFREGTLSLTFSFFHEKKSLRIDELVKILGKIEQDAFELYKEQIQNICRDWGKKHTFDKQLIFKKKDNIDNALKIYSVKHSCIFLEEVIDINHNHDQTSTNASTLFKESASLPGILNKTKWYKQYSEKYIKRVSEKNVGYRNDEIYLTDKDSTLVLLKDYWADENSLQLYMEELILAIQIQVANIAFIKFFSGYLYFEEKSFGSKKSTAKDVESILDARKILNRIHEAMDTNLWIIHGFSKNFVEQIMQERNFQSYLELIERRIDNLSKSIELKSYFHIGKSGLLFNQVSINIAIIALMVSIFLTIISIYINNS